MRTLLARLKGLVTRRRDDARIREEIGAHLDLLAEEFERRGMAPTEARLAAQREFGGVARTAETWREGRSLPLVESLAKDLRYAWRQLRANPGFAAAAVMTLALGIGANTAIFRVLDAVVLRWLPVRQPERLVLVGAFHDGKPASFNYPLFREVAARQQALEGMFAVTDFPVREEGIAGRLVSGSYFRLLGVDARLGRVLTDDDDRPAAAPVAVISHAYWQRAWGSRSDVLGQSLRINNAVAGIVGVAPPEFFGERVGSSPDVYLPMSLAPRVWVNFLDSPAFGVLSIMGRLRPGVPLAQAQASLHLLDGQLRDFQLHTTRHPNDYRLRLVPGGQGIRDLQKQFSTPLTVLMCIVGLVLLLACSNLANLLLTRATARTHEIGVRLALGAARSRLVRQLLTESLLLAGMGSVVGMAIAAWGSGRMIALASAGRGWRIHMDDGWRVLAFTAAISILAACLFGLAPALAATRLDVHSALRANARSQGGRRRMLASVFVVAQVTVSLVLLAGASLFVRSFWNLATQDFGFRREGVLVVQVPFDMSAARGSQAPLYGPIRDRMNALPGVRSAALSGLGPFADFQHTGTVATPDRPARDGDVARFASVSPRYFETMGIRIVAGRPITEEDREGAVKVAVISEAAARQLFGTDDPVGRVFSTDNVFKTTNAVRVVGVAHDLRFSDPRDPFGVVVYQPLAQVPVPLSSVVLRTEGDPAAFVTAARQAMGEAAPGLKIGEIKPLTHMVLEQLRQDRMMALISGAFGLLALVLSSVGLYGVVAYAVERRTQEVGIRLALGASRSQVAGLLLRDLAGVLAMGLALGGACVVALGQWVRAMLFGLTGRDPAMLLAAAALLGVVGLVAGCVPAGRAARMDPVRALRQE